MLAKVSGGKEPALDNWPIPDLRKAFIRTSGSYEKIPVALPGKDHVVELRRDLGDARNRTRNLKVRHSQADDFPFSTSHTWGPTADRDDFRTEALDILDDLPVSRCADGQHGEDRADTDHDSEHGQSGLKLLARNRGQPHGDCGPQYLEEGAAGSRLKGRVTICRKGWGVRGGSCQIGHDAAVLHRHDAVRRLGD